MHVTFPRSRRRRALRAVAAGLAGLVAAGCYTYTPLLTVPEPGTRLAVELNDHGRVALADHVGPEVAVLEGDLQARTDSTLILAVREVRGLYGSRSQWAGEPVTVTLSAIRTLRERQFDRGRTILTGGAVASGVLAFVLTRGLLGGASGSNVDPPDGPITGGGTNLRN